MSALNIVPPEGIIPFGGLSTIYMTYTPDTTDKFQARVKVCSCMCAPACCVCLRGFVWLFKIFVEVGIILEHVVIMFTLRKLVLMISNENGF